MSIYHRIDEPATIMWFDDNNYVHHLHCAEFVYVLDSSKSPNSSPKEVQPLTLLVPHEVYNMNDSDEDEDDDVEYENLSSESKDSSKGLSDDDDGDQTNINSSQ